MDSGKLAFITDATRSSEGHPPQVLTLPGEARSIAWRLRRCFFRGMPTGPEAIFGNARSV